MTSISYQLYGSRNWPLAETLAMVSKAGFTAVEGYRDLFAQTPAIDADLKAAGLRMPSLHYGLADLEADPQAAIALCRAVGAEALFAPYLAAEDRPTDRAGWEAFAQHLVATGKPVQEAGLVFGWHNHDFELVDLGNGVTPLDLIARASPDLKLELDLGWVVRAGKDPVALIAAYGPQIHSAHIKDIAAPGDCADEGGWADVGHGVVDWPVIHAALQQAGVTRYVIEHDNPKDHHRFASRSFAAVTAF